MPRKRRNAEMLEEYDFSRGVRGKYADRTKLVLLDRDVVEVFRDSKTVNDVLRKLAKIVKQVAKAAHR